MAGHNPFPGENNTGHVWDNTVRELNNPIPRWWMMGFYISLAWIVGYTILYPTMLPNATDTEGLLGWTKIKEFNKSMEEVEVIRAKYETQISAKTAAEILADDGLSTCGQGAPSFPVLADDDWLYGGTVENLVHTITNGRRGMMPAQVSLKPDEVDALANAIINGSVVGEPLFKTKSCFACHGLNAKGNPALGSVDLTDSIYRFVEEDQLASVKQTIRHGVNFIGDKETRVALMPSFKKRLNENDIKKLAVYVHNLGGGL
jgi:cytochrome c oxidase cbb3-type subunit 3